MAAKISRAALNEYSPWQPQRPPPQASPSAPDYTHKPIHSSHLIKQNKGISEMGISGLGFLFLYLI